VTTNNIDSLEAGREMDALVATEVMGLPPWKEFVLEDIPGEPCGGFGDYCNADLHWKHNDQIKERGINDLKRPWDYSTSISAAWQVVEKLHSLGWVVDVTVDNGTGRYCKVWKMGNDGRDVGSEERDALTAPLAICRAALKAVNNEKTLAESQTE